ncbi:MAG: hypothetical protein ABEJ70_02110 [Halobacteriaceae archaeon]
MSEERVEPVGRTSITRFWVVGGWTRLVVGDVLLALSTVVQ